MDDALKEYLQRHNIAYILHTHPAVFTVKESHNEPAIKNIPGLRTKSLFLKDEQGRFYLVCMPGEKRLSIRALENKMEVKKLRFGTPDEMKQEIHCMPGSVSPCGILYAKNTRLIVDVSVWDALEVGFHPAINTATLVLSRARFRSFFHSLAVPKEVINLE